MIEAQGQDPTLPLTAMALLPNGPLLADPAYLLQELLRESAELARSGSAQLPEPNVSGPNVMAANSGGHHRVMRFSQVKLEGVIRDYSAEYVVEALNKAYADRETSGVLLKVNTGGGSVTASQMIHDSVQNRNKPLVVHAHFMASGGVMATRDADEIVAASPTALIGSIGVAQEVATWYREFLNRYFTTVYANTSPEKNATWREFLRTGEAAVFQPLLNELDANFMAAVTASRPLPAATRANTLKGGTWLAEEAKRRGLVDSIGGTQFVINRLAEAVLNYL